MFKGLVYALSACFIWGLIFIVPGFMSTFSPIEISLGRYLIYGIISFLAFKRGGRSYSKNIWIKSLFYSLIITLGYYTCLVLAVRYATPAICALVIGVSPIVIAFYGNWKQREISFRSLILPSILTLVGLVLINAPHLQDNETPTTYLWGLFYAALSLGSWSWYVVANARFLKNNPDVDSGDWNNLVGITSMLSVVVLTPTLMFFCPSQFNFEAYQSWNVELKHFILGTATLGILCSWLASDLWNKASLHLPVSLAGQLTIFETIFGVLFFYTLQQHLPPTLECVGIALFLFSILFGIRQFSKQTALQQ